MKAVIYTEYGAPEVLQLKEVEKPVPANNEVLIRVHAASVNYGDIIARNFKNISPRQFNMPSLFWLLARLGFGFRRPRRNILGNTFSGAIEAAGKDVQNFTAGDRVFGYTGEKMSTYASYVCVPANGILSLKPPAMTFEDAAAVPYGAVMALNLLKKANLRKGQHILIIGASGGIGSAAVQLARHYFEVSVTGVCSTHSMEFVKMLGADSVIDYTKEDFTENGATFDMILDIPGKGSFTRCRKLMKPNGIYLAASFKTRKLLQMFGTSISGKRRLICVLAVPGQEDMLVVKELAEKGKLMAVIDQCFPLEKAADAHRYMESESRKGSVVITMQDKDNGSLPGIAK